MHAASKTRWTLRASPRRRNRRNFPRPYSLTKDANGGRKPITAKAETVGKLLMFRDACARRRCTIPGQRPLRMEVHADGEAAILHHPSRRLDPFDRGALGPMEGYHKILAIDGREMFTGSLNFTRAAQS